MGKCSYLFLLSSVAAVAFNAMAGTAWAGPQDGIISAGSASITQNGTTTNITQQSDKAILDWRSFDVGVDERVDFHQPTSSSMTLNRINDTDASRIDGAITANGHVMLINPNGIVFGAGAQVDVGSLTATTADIDNDDFMAGQLDFNKAGKNDASIINYGSITAKEAGLVSLVAPRVENHGVIAAKLGKIQLSATDTFALDMAGDGLLQVAVTDEDAKKLVKNTGYISAQDGVVALTAGRARNIVDSLVDNSGVIEAQSMTRIGGKIILSGSHTKLSGTLDASGKTGGGEILIGGDYQGSGDIETSQVTEINDTAKILANATDEGDGGKVIVWADGATRFEGKIEAKGGPNGGNGGFTEVSGKGYLEFAGEVDLRGDEIGTLLLDPDAIEIVAGGSNPAEFADNLIAFAENGGGTSTIGADTVNSTLSANASVILQANNTIDVNAAVNSTGSGYLRLETASGGTITINQAIDTNTGSLYLIGDEIDINANLSGTGLIRLTTADVAQEIEIGSTDAAALNLTATELSYLQDGWNYIEIGDSTHETYIRVNEAVTFSDDTKLINKTDASLTAPIYIYAPVTTTDNADLILTGKANPAGDHGYLGVYISADLDVARDLLINARAGAGISANTVTVGRDFIVSIGNGFSLDTDVIVGNDFSFTQEAQSFNLYTGHTIDAGGDISIDAGSHSGGTVLKLQAGSSLLADGDITLEAETITIDPTASISGNADGSSNLIFLEGGNDDPMEVGGTTAGYDWNLTADEIATIQDGFNSITIGSTSQAEVIEISGDVTFSDNTSIIAGTLVDINAAITTTDNADLYLRGSGSGTGVHPWAGVHVGADLDVDHDLQVVSSPDAVFYTSTVTIGHDFIINTGNAVTLHTDLNVGNDFTLVGEDHHDLYVREGFAIDIGGDFIFKKNVLTMYAGSSLHVDGDITIESSRVNLDPTASISGNIDGSSNITFLEYDEDDPMEIGSTTAGYTWQMTAAELATIQDGFNTITFGSTSYTQAIELTAATSFSDDVVFLNTGDDATIVVSGTLTTTDNANATLESGSAANVGWDAINIDADLDIAGNLITRTGTGSGAGHVDIQNTNFDVGGDWTLLSDFNGILSTTNLNVGGDINAERGSKISAYKMTATNAVIGGDLIIDAHRYIGLHGSYDVTGKIDLSSQDSTYDINITADLVTGSTIDLVSGGNIFVGNDLTSTGNIVINADSDANDTGIIKIENAVILTNGGDFIAGGGADPLTAAAHAGQDGVYDIGVELDNVQVNTGVGAISIRGEGEDTGADNYGVYIHTDSTLTSTTGAITLEGSGGSGTNNNYGIFLDGDTVLITSDEGNILLNGTGGQSATGIDNAGIRLYSGADILSTGTTANAAMITLNGVAGRNGEGIYLNGGSIRSGYGDITLTGTYDSLMDSNGTGIFISTYESNGATEGIVESTGTDGAVDAANITINAVGKDNHGLFMHVGTNLKTVDGDIDITAYGENGLGAVALRYSSSIISSGTGDNAGNITIDVTSGDGSGDKIGLGVLHSSKITTVDGDIDITARGGNTDNGVAHGIQIGQDNGSVSKGITSTGDGNITLDGTAGDCTLGSCYGVFLTDTTSGTDNFISTTSTGNITIIGRGGNTGSNNHGIYLETGAYIESTASGINAGTITLTGTGGNGNDSNHGVYITGTGTEIRSIDGAMSFIGQGGSNGTIGSSDNYGIYVADGADITSTGTGADAATITFDGTGGAGYDNNIGVNISGIGVVVTSDTGNIDITGRGGADTVNYRNGNHGVRNAIAARVSSTGTGSDAATITVNGIAGQGTSFNNGVEMTGSSRFVSSYGDISISGTGGTSGSGISTGNRGVRVSNGSLISSDGTLSGAANIMVIGTGANADDDNYGISIESTGNIRTVNGDMNIIGQGGSNGLIGSENNHGINIQTSGYISSYGTGAITIEGSSTADDGYGLHTETGTIDLGGVNASGFTITADSVNFVDLNSLQTAGDLIIQNRTAGTTIGLGGGAGDLNIDDADLAQFSVGGDLIIGSGTAGAVHVDSVDFTGVTANNLSLLGGNFTIDGAVTAGNSISMISNGDMMLNGFISASGAGNSVVLVSDGFINNGGGAAIDAGAGRYLIYLDSPSVTDKGGLSGTNYYNRTYAGYPPASVTETGDLFFYAYQPVLTFTADDISLDTFDLDYDRFTYSLSGLQTGDTAESVFSGMPVFEKSWLGNEVYNVHGSAGTLTSLTGYQFAFVDGTLSMPTPSQGLGSGVQSQMQGTDSASAASNSDVNEPLEALLFSEQEAQNGDFVADTDLIEIEQPLIDFYDLCSYNDQYCQ